MPCRPEPTWKPVALRGGQPRRLLVVGRTLPYPGSARGIEPLWDGTARGLLRLSRWRLERTLLCCPKFPVWKIALAFKWSVATPGTGGHPGPPDSAVGAGPRAGFRGVRLSEQGPPRKQTLEEASELTRGPLGPSALVTMTPAAEAGSWLTPSRPMSACGWASRCHRCASHPIFS